MTKRQAKTASSGDREAVRRLLVVEADPVAGQAIAEAAAGALPGPAEIVAAGCGRSAGEALRAAPFDVVLADIASLGDLGAGPERAVGRLARAAGPALIVALSEEVSVSGAVAAMSAGAHEYIAKPVSGPVLAARIAELARRHGKAWAMPAPTCPPIPVATAIAAPTPSGLPEAVTSPAAAVVAASAAPGPVLPMWRQEQRIIEEALAHFSGNIARAAAALEISPSTIYRKRQAWDDDPSARRSA